MSNDNSASNYIVNETNNKVYIHVTTFEDTVNYKFVTSDYPIEYSSYVCEIPPGTYSNWETLMSAFIVSVENRTGISFTCTKNNRYNDYTLASSGGKGFVLTYGPGGIQGLNFFANYPFLPVENALVNKSRGSFVKRSVTFADHTKLAIIVKDPKGNTQGWGSIPVVTCNGVTNDLVVFEFGSYTLEKAVANITSKCEINFPDNPPVAKITTCNDISILRISNIDEIWLPTSMAKAFGLNTINSEGIKQLDKFDYIDNYTMYNIRYYSATNLIKNRTIGFAFKHFNHDIGDFKFEGSDTDILIPGTTAVQMPFAIANLVRDTINGVVQQTVSSSYAYNSSDNIVYIGLNRDIVDTYGLTINEIKEVNYDLTPVINASHCKINLKWLADTIVYRSYIYDSYGDYAPNNAVYNNSSSCIFGYCGESISENVTWEKTPMGRYVWKPCPTGFTYSMKRECDLKGRWSAVDKSTCVPVCLKDGSWEETEQGKTIELTETDKHSGGTISRRCSYPSETEGVSQWGGEITFPDGTENIVCKNFDNITGVPATVPFGETVSYTLIEETDNKVHKNTYSITCDKEGLVKDSATLTGAVRFCPADESKKINEPGLGDVSVQCPNDSSKNIIYTCNANYTWGIKENQCETETETVSWFAELWQQLWFKIVVIVGSIAILIIFGVIIYRLSSP